MERAAVHRPTRLEIDPEHPQPHVIREAAERLARGEIGAIPTDTVYGVAMHPDAPGATERLAKLKARDPGKPIAFLVDGVDATVRSGAQMSPKARALAKAYWPGPLTIVLTAGEVTEGFRVPAHAATLALLTECGGALRVTSANRSGEPDARSAEAALEALSDGLDFVIDGGFVGEQLPSSVVRVDGDNVELLREGAISRGALEELVGILAG